MAKTALQTVRAISRSGEGPVPSQDPVSDLAVLLHAKRSDPIVTSNFLPPSPLPRLSLMDIPLLPSELKMALSSSLPLSFPNNPNSLLPNSSHKRNILQFHGHHRAISLKSTAHSRLSSNEYHPICCSKTPAAVDSSGEKQPSPSLFAKNAPEAQVRTGMWNWRGYNIRYQFAGEVGPALVLVHGFGANSDHWRKNISYLAKTNRAYSIDLIGYGYSDKPNPRDFKENSFYTFETWANQLNEFCTDIVKDEAFFVCNSIGGVVGLQAAIMEPQICKGILLLNISLRMLHIKKQPWYGRPFIKSFQNLLRNTFVGKLFFNAVATPESVRNILCQCYHDKSAVTDELVQIILQPGLDPGAVDVFLDFICYSGGPLPEELLPQVKCPVLVAWGDKDPWEPLEFGRAYADFDTVEDFVVLPNVGHCPQDEAPHLVNPLIETFVKRHSKEMIGSSL